MRAHPPFCDSEGGEISRRFLFVGLDVDFLKLGSFLVYCFVFSPSPPPASSWVPYHSSGLVNNQRSRREETSHLLIEEGVLDLFPCRLFKEPQMTDTLEKIRSYKHMVRLQVYILNRHRV